MVTAARILGDQVGSTAPMFLAFLAVHVLAGLTAVVTGAVAALVRKGSPRHIRAGRWYYLAITVVFVTATVLAALRWRQDYHLFIIGALAFTAATIGYQPGCCRPATMRGQRPLYSSSVPCSPQSISGRSPAGVASVMDKWVMKWPGAAPCQCHSSAGV